MSFYYVIRHFPPFLFKQTKIQAKKLRLWNEIIQFHDFFYIFYNLQFGTMNQKRCVTKGLEGTNKNLFIYVPKPEHTLSLRKYSIRVYLLNESPLFTFRQRYSIKKYLCEWLSPRFICIFIITRDSWKIQY